jgi:maltose alpha-D-glucosyltransferase/alpha-amylase
MLTDDPLWYKDAIIYQLHIKAFFDSSDDGIGDFRGLAQKLDYIQDLGVTAIWLLPFYPSPLRDDGYDIADYRAINPTYGTMRDFRKFVREAHRRGLRVITELVINHTSDQHPWFQRARAAKAGSARRNFYVWSDTDQTYQGTRIIFTDTETSNWAWDPVAQAYFWHRFFSHQPDLNFDNPRVIEAVISAMRFWLDMGVDGLRLDAIPYLCERDGTNNENLPETHAVLKRLRAALDESHPGRMFLAEANQWPEDVRPYFGDGDECHMAFHFPVMPRLYMAVAQEDRHPITDIMRQTPDIPDTCQWALFLRNHDELTLEMVTDRERDYLWSLYAADRRTRINLGIRRRLAPLLDNDRRNIELLNSLLLSLPGTPIIYYGDEIGMGDNVFLGDRDGVRTPMQWSPDRNAGFSRATPAQLYLPAIMDPVYGYEAVNVEAQSRNPSSLLSWMKRLIGVRTAHKAFGRGRLDFLYPGNRKVLAYLRQHDGQAILCVANLSRAPQPVELNLSEFEGRVPVELVGRSPFPPIGKLPYFVTLPGHGFYWFLLAEEVEAPKWHAPFLPQLPELQTLVMPQGWPSLLSGSATETLERRSLPEFLANRRWFAAKDVGIKGVALNTAAELTDAGESWLMATYRVDLLDDTAQIYFVPLSIAWEAGKEDPLAGLVSDAIARVRRGPRLGVLYDALADESLACALVRFMREDREVFTATGERLVFSSTLAFESVAGAELAEVYRLAQEHSNTSVVLGEAMVLKAYRQVHPGVQPELEIGRYLTEVARYPHTPAFLGAIEHVDTAGTATALAVLQGFVRNQGDGWSFTLDHLDRFLAEADLLPQEVEPEEAEEEDRHAIYLQLAHTLGVRTAELHRAFALDSGDPAFQPEPIGRADLERWVQLIRDQAARAHAALGKAKDGLPEDIASQTDDVLERWDEVTALIDRLVPDRVDAVKTRYHGDFHLGQVIVVKDDFYIIDFEGEPARPLAERRAKHSPLKDVAGMLRSFDYAAWAGLHAQAETRPQAYEMLLPWAEDWRSRAIAAFLDGYDETIDDCPSYPADPAIARNLVDLFVLEKAMYEICYEAANRPSWLHIPLQGVLGLLGSRD